MNSNTNKKKLNLLVSLSLFVLFLILLLLLLFVDRNPVGLDSIEVGFSKINSFFYSKLEYNETSYKMSEFLGWLSLIIPLTFAFSGFIQLLKRKSFIKVDQDILFMGLIYIITITFYVFFLFVAVNYKPVVLDDGLKPSFPSSHTLLSITVVGTLIVYLNKNVANKNTVLILDVLSVLIAIGVITFRFTSGVHWFTDILASIILSSSIIFLYKGLITEKQ